MSESSLKDKTVRGVGWSAIDNVVQYVVSFVVGIILARLLSPDDYGLLGLTAIFTAICNTIVDGGFSTALIRKKDITEDDYNTAFIVNFGLSLFLYFGLFFSAPLIAVFFGRNELIPLTRVTSLGLILGALSLVQQTRLTKKIDFKTQTKITLIASLASGVIGIMLAVLGFGVWALVAQTLSSRFVKTLLLWFYNKWVPKIRFSFQSFRELFGFGWKMMAAGLLDSIWKELFQVVVGKFYNPATLGQYTRAKQFSNLFSSNLTGVVQRVSFPVMSDIQYDKQRLVAAYRKIIKTTMFVTAIGMFSLGAVSEPLLYCLIGSKWHEAAMYLPLICISGSLFPLHAINLNMLQVKGRSDLFLRLEIIKKIIALGPLFVGAFVGIMPMLYANIVVSLIAYFLNSFYSGRLIGYSIWEQIKDISLSYGIATAIAISVWFLKYIPISNWVILPLQVVVGVTMFFVFCRATKIEEYVEVKAILESYFKKLRINKR